MEFWSPAERYYTNIIRKKILWPKEHNLIKNRLNEHKLLFPNSALVCLPSFLLLTLRGRHRGSVTALCQAEGQELWQEQPQGRGGACMVPTGEDTEGICSRA